MCGICGFTGKPENREDVIRRMTDVITHRGPDSEGFYSDDFISMGFRRLSIIDLQAGHQPIYNEDKTLVLTFNGEIYNYKALRKELAEKGLFDEAHKQPIPFMPKSVGVITSPTGAALQDIKNILGRRCPGVEIVICPVLVQGDSAPAQLVSAVRRLDEAGCCDVIILGRGGGSIEDLWAFNDRQLAFAVYECRTPVISAVGHETDFTICDFVADLRAPTPSAAAELAVPDCAELRADVISTYKLGRAEVIKRYQEQLSALIADVRQHAALSPMGALDALESDLLLLGTQAKNSVQSCFSAVEGELKSSAAAAEALNPIATLARGYAIAERGGELIYSINQLNEGDRLDLRFSDGAVKAIVTGD